MGNAPNSAENGLPEELKQIEDPAPKPPSESMLTVAIRLTVENLSFEQTPVDRARQAAIVERVRIDPE